MNIAFLTNLAAHCLALTASSIAAFDDIHALRELAAVRYRSFQPAAKPSQTLFYRAREHTYTRTYATALHCR